MTWYPIAFLPPQIEDDNGIPYSGAVLKAYAAQTSDNILISTDTDGTNTAESIALNDSGFPVYAGAVIIPHVQENYKLALYPDQGSADLDSGALWTVDNINIAVETGAAFVQTFSGDGITGDFTLTEDLGTNEDTVMVFADRIEEYTTNGGFDADTDWTKGAGWTIASGVATATTASTDLEQTAAITVREGELYTVTFTVSNRTGGDVTPKIGGVSGTARSADGTYTETILAGNTQLIEFTGNTFSGDIDDISVYRAVGERRTILSSSEFTISGTTLSINKVPPAGTNNVLVFAPSLLVGELGTLVSSAATSETNAAASAAAAAASAARLSGTSTTSVLIGSGSKVFETQESKLFDAGVWVLISSDADPTNYMHGQVTSYSSTTLTVNVTNVGGAGTFADWTITVSGTRGAQGASGTVSGAANVGAESGDKLLMLDANDSDALIYDTIEDVVLVALLDEDDFASNSDQKAPTQQSVKEYVDANSQVTAITAGDNLVGFTGTDIEYHTTSASFIPVFEVVVPISGVVRVSYELQDVVPSSGSARGQLYLNGVIEGAEHSETGGTWTADSQDITVSAGDKIRLDIRFSTSGTVGARNFEVKVAESNLQAFPLWVNSTLQQ